MIGSIKKFLGIGKIYRCLFIPDHTRSPGRTVWKAASAAEADQLWSATIEGHNDVAGTYIIRIEQEKIRRHIRGSVVQGKVHPDQTAFEFKTAQERVLPGVPATPGHRPEAEAVGAGEVAARRGGGEAGHDGAKPQRKPDLSDLLRR